MLVDTAIASFVSRLKGGGGGGGIATPAFEDDDPPLSPDSEGS